MVYNINLQDIADKLDFDLEDVEMLMEVFIETVNESLESLKNAIDANNLEDIYRSSHAIKGSAANLTLTNIAEIAKDIEEQSRNNNNINYLEKYKSLKVLISEL